MEATRDIAGLCVTVKSAASIYQRRPVAEVGATEAHSASSCELHSSGLDPVTLSQFRGNYGEFIADGQREPVEVGHAELVVEQLLSRQSCLTVHQRRSKIRRIIALRH